MIWYLTNQPLTLPVKEVMSGKTDHNIVVIGTSAGGLEALRQLLKPLKKDLPAALFIVQHLALTSSTEIHVEILQKHTALLCKAGEDGETIQPGTVYLAPADQHMMFRGNRLHLTRGPRENGFRPAIDTLFRSAAAHHDSRVIGILLTGMLYDGTVGMEAIRRSGGITVVQDPNDAPYPNMPANVLLHMEVDHNLPVAEIGILLEELVHRKTHPHTIPDDIKAEAAIAERMLAGTQQVEPLGYRSPITCPDCGGILWEMKEGSITRFRCHTGHTHVAESVLLHKDKQLEETLWIALRILEERRNMLVLIAGESRNAGAVKEMYQSKIEETESHIERIRRLIFSDAGSPEVLRQEPKRAG